MVASRQNQYERRKSAEAAEIGSIPPVSDPARRESCRSDLHKFLITYFPHSTGLSPFSDDHLRQIGHMQECILHGGWFVEAVYRGFAKTTISENAALWAALYGHRSYIPIFGVSKEASGGNIESIKMELAENPLLGEDFPEACYPVAKLENKAQRCRSQTCEGRPTHIVWRSDTIVFPSVRVDGKPSISGGSIIRAKPYAKSRGLVFKRPDGTQARPDFAIIDDPQDDESAISPAQVAKNLNVLHKAILPSAAHRRRLACVVNATVIARDDMIERLLVNPAWQGERIPMVKTWANAHETLWREYADIRRRFDRSAPGDKERAAQEATAYYVARLAEMDAGCEVSWSSCYSPDDGEVSAIQHAYNALIDLGEEVFASEYQNAPLAPADEHAILTRAIIGGKCTGMGRGVVPGWAHTLTAFTDVHGELLYWIVLAAGDGFRCQVVEYGTWPPQKRSQFLLRDANPRLSDVTPGGTEAAIRAGLDAVASSVLAREFHREDGSVLRVKTSMVDANWGQQTDTVYEWCRRCPQMPVPSHGKYLGATSPLWTDRRPEAGEENGLHWRIPNYRGSKRPQRHAIYDTNFWKSFAAARLLVPVGGSGSMELWGAAAEHDLLMQHWLSEQCIAVTARNRTIHEWKLPQPIDNHWFDCIIGACVAASMCGISERVQVQQRPPRRRPKVKYF